MLFRSLIQTVLSDRNDGMRLERRSSSQSERTVEISQRQLNEGVWGGRSSHDKKREACLMVNAFFIVFVNDPTRSRLTLFTFSP